MFTTFHASFTDWDLLFPKEFTGHVYNSNMSNMSNMHRADREMCSLRCMGAQIQGLTRQSPSHAVRFLLL